MPFNLFTHETRTAHAQKVSEKAAQRVKYEKFSSYKIEIVIRFFQMNFPRKTNIIYFNLPLFLCIHAVPHIANTHTPMPFSLMCFVCGGTYSSFGTHCELVFSNFSLLLNIRNAKRLIRITSCRTFFMRLAKFLRTYNACELCMAERVMPLYLTAAYSAYEMYARPAASTQPQSVCGKAVSCSRK